MLSRANLYIGAVAVTGLASLVFGLSNWQTDDGTRFVIYCGLALLASGMKVIVPAAMGTMSMNFVLVLIGIAELNRCETLVIGCIGMLVQSLVHTKTKPNPIKVLFNVASMATSITAAYVVHAPQVGSGWIDSPLSLLLPGTIFFLTNTWSVAVVISLTESKNAWAVWREAYFWTFPNYLVGAAFGWIVSATSRTFGWQVSLMMLPLLYLLYRSHYLYVKRFEDDKLRSEEQRLHAEEIASLHHRTIKALALAIEAKDQTTHDHLQRVEVYAMEVAKELGLDSQELQALRASALLHDIGKLAVPEYIISKPGRLTREEFEKMKIHPVVGAEILESVRFPYPVAPIVRSHHEKWDGSGYPDGLSGKEIPIGARILSAVDCLDALASDRQYRRALPLHEAIKVVESEAGKAFDPDVVEILARRYVELEKMATSGGPGEKLTLSLDAKITRGDAPAAGFESNGSAQRDLINFGASIDAEQGVRDTIASLHRALDGCESRVEVLGLVAELVRGVIRYDALALYMRQDDHLVPAIVDGEEFVLFSSLEIPVGMGLSGWVAENAKSILNGNPSVEPGYLNDPRKFSTLRSAMAVPLEIAGNVIGVLSLYRHDRDAFSKQQLGVLVSFATKLAITLDAKKSHVAAG